MLGAPPTGGATWLGATCRRSLTTTGGLPQPRPAVATSDHHGGNLIFGTHVWVCQVTHHHENIEQTVARDPLASSAGDRLHVDEAERASGPVRPTVSSPSPAVPAVAAVTGLAVAPPPPAPRSPQRAAATAPARARSAPAPHRARRQLPLRHGGPSLASRSPRTACSRWYRSSAPSSTSWSTSGKRGSRTGCH